MQWLQLGQTLEFFFAISDGIIPRNFTDSDYKDMAMTCNPIFDDDPVLLEEIKVEIYSIIHPYQ